MKRKLLIATALLALSATGLFATPTAAIIAVPACRNFLYIDVHTGASHECYCNYGQVCTATPGIPHCDPPYDVLCYNSAPNAPDQNQ